MGVFGIVCVDGEDEADEAALLVTDGGRGGGSGLGNCERRRRWCSGVREKARERRGEDWGE